MILIDAGPLIALIDKGQNPHRRCVELYQNLNQSLITTWPCLTEAMYFLGELRGWQAQRVLWQFLERRALAVHFSDVSDQRRMQELMERYQDVPMDLADASLVAAAESLNLRRIFTLDRDFYVYRLPDNQSFDVLNPEI